MRRKQFEHFREQTLTEEGADASKDERRRCMRASSELPGIFATIGFIPACDRDARHAAFAVVFLQLID